MKRTPWTERKFKFDFPVSNFPVIAERLRGTAPHIADMIRTCDDNFLSKVHIGKWSIKQHIGHLIDLEELHEGRIDDFKNNLKVLRAADMNNAKTNEADHNAVPIQTLMQDLKYCRSHFITRLEALTSEELAKVSMHPRLNTPMRQVDMAFFVAEHDDQHLAIIREILRTKQA